MLDSSYQTDEVKPTFCVTSYRMDEVLPGFFHVPDGLGQVLFLHGYVLDGRSPAFLITRIGRTKSRMLDSLYWMDEVK